MPKARLFERADGCYSDIRAEAADSGTIEHAQEISFR